MRDENKDDDSDEENKENEVGLESSVESVHVHVCRDVHPSMPGPFDFYHATEHTD